MLNFVPDGFIFIFLDAKDNQPELGKIWETKLFRFTCKFHYKNEKIKLVYELIKITTM